MYKGIFENIENIAIWPVISFVIFFLFFLFLLWWVITADKKLIIRMKNLPFEGKEDSTEINQKTIDKK